LKAEAERRAEEDKARALQVLLAQIEHAEEQRKLRELQDALPPVTVQEEITDGVFGLTPPTSEMSDHLKRILRQDRDFNV
jgi:hypothetical protein